MTRQIKVAWIGGIALVLAAIVTGIFSMFDNPKQSSTKTIIQNVDTGVANNAGRDLNQAGRDNLNAGGISIKQIFMETHLKKEI